MEQIQEKVEMIVAFTFEAEEKILDSLKQAARDGELTSEEYIERVAKTLISTHPEVVDMINH